MSEQVTRVADAPERGRFEVFLEGELGGFAEYKLNPGSISFIHTEIDPRFEGHGLAGRLVREALDTARERGLKVYPYCPFVRGWIAKHPDYLDLVPEKRRAQFDLA
ncbi:GNAT family N-acetyltransferase [Actinocorallia lasiicapitis]